MLISNHNDFVNQSNFMPDSTCSQFDLISTGEVKEVFPFVLGTYVLQDIMINRRVVYQLGTEGEFDYYLFSLEHEDENVAGLWMV